eukprot:g18660.t1
MASSSYDDLFESATGFQVKHKTEFASEAGEALRMTVRQRIQSKAGLKKIGRSILVFDFEPIGTITADSSPTASGRGAAAVRDSSGAADAVVAVMAHTQEAAGEATRLGGVAGGEDLGAVGSATRPRGSCVVFVHDRYNGAKELYINRALVYSVKKECTDGNMNSWVLPLPFGRAVLRLTSKLFSSSGFEYSLALGDGKSSFLYKSTQ